jgi:hypothetical protein
MSEAENRSLLVFDVMRGCHRNVGVARHLLGGSKAAAGIDLASDLSCALFRLSGFITACLGESEIAL